MPDATADGITLINFGMGSPNAATVTDLLSAISPKAVLFLGKCGGLKRKDQIGDLILPSSSLGSAVACFIASIPFEDDM
jgi:AMP nucleosidase